MITFAIEAKLGRDADSSVIEENMSPWTTALARIEDKLTEPSRIKALWQGAAAFSVISTLLSSVLLVLTSLYFTVLRDQIRRSMLYTVAFVDAMRFLGAGVMVGHAMREGPRGIMECDSGDRACLSMSRDDNKAKAKVEYIHMDH
ncbi:hypothetical protein F53441_341 [Fusarium austroafricanum]|uniref:Uncharacterized protein n=1 Tax=Fusarium austroafricanum TaxID=2364996 RepID=A0A8H4P0A3_9HYPO|nr:hypothetical protein F53441_341 [Fusarium austroafricanum]